MESKDLTIDTLHFPRFKQWKRRSLDKITSIVLHCSDMNWTIDDLYQYDVMGYHKDMQWINKGKNLIDSSGLPFVSYHEVFMPDGLRYHCNDAEDLVWHAQGHNTYSLGTCLMYRPTNGLPGGKILGPDLAPTQAQVTAFVTWAAAVVICLDIDPTRKILGHRELEGTGWFWEKGHKRLRKRCPGMAIDLPALRERIARQAQRNLAAHNLYAGKIDGIWGPETQFAVNSFRSTRTAARVGTIL